MIVRAVLFSFVLLLVPSWATSRAFAASDLSFDGILSTPLSRVVPGGVLLLQANVGNSGDALAEGMIVVSIEEFPKIQSARRVVLEPGKHEKLDLFVQMPETLQGLESIHITATMVVRSGEREVILERNGTPARHTMTLGVSLGRTLGMAMQPDPLELPAWYWPQALPQTDYEFAIATRLEAGHDRTAATFAERPIPLNGSSWAGLDLFVIADPRVLEDGAIVQSLRRYVSSGGRLWIMLDLVPCALVRSLLSPHQLCEEIERIELNDFVVDPIGSTVQQSEQDRRVVSQLDIPMARVVQEGGRVRFEVDGWPAAIEMNVGYGQLVLTTLDSRAWIEPRTKKISQDSRFLSTYQPRAWAKYFAIGINESRSTLPLTERVQYPLKHIGNPIVPRSWVAAALLGFFACLAGLGFWSSYMGRLSVIGLVVPAAAIALSFSLVGVANWIRRDIPESLSRFQIVEVSSDGNFASIREQAAVFLASAASMQLDCTHDGVARTSEAITTGIQRCVQEDFQKWNLANDAWPPGSWRYEADYTLPAQQLTVRGSLSKTGLHLQLPDNLPSALEDPVLSFSTGDPMLCDPSDSGFDANNKITVDGDRWILGSFLSDEQQRRLELYRQFFQADNSLRRPTQRLYGWTHPWDAASWNHDLRQLGSALVALPVVLERPAIGSEILVPHGLIKLQRDLTSVGITSTFDDRSGKWREDNSVGVEAEMQFVLPLEVVPIAATAIELELSIRAPQRDVTISIQTRSGSHELIKLDSPSIPWTATITDTAVLEAVEDGTLNVRIRVSENRNLAGNGITSNMIQWQIKHFHASVRGTVQAKSSLSSETP